MLSSFSSGFIKKQTQARTHKLFEDYFEANFTAQVLVLLKTEYWHYWRQSTGTTEDRVLVLLKTEYWYYWRQSTVINDTSIKLGHLLSCGPQIFLSCPCAQKVSRHCSNQSQKRILRPALAPLLITFTNTCEGFIFPKKWVFLFKQYSYPWKLVIKV